MKRKILILLSVFITLLLCGCYDYDEPDDIAYVVAIGVDEGRDESLYTYTIQFARPNEISGGSSEEGGSGKNTIGTLTVESPSVYSAVNIANHAVSKTFTLSHTKVIVLSDKIAKKSISPILDSIGRSSDIRPSVFICIANGEAKEYLKSVKPIIEINPVKYYRLIFENENSSYVPKQNARNVYFNLKSKENQIILPLVGVGEGTQNDEDKEKEDEKQKENVAEKNIPLNNMGFEYKMKKYIAGNLDIEKQNESEVIGSAVFKNDRMIDYLSNIESEIFNIVTGDFKNAYTVIYNKNAPQNPTTVRIEQINKPSIKVDTKSGYPKIKINITLEGNFMSVSDDSPPDKDISDFEEDTAQYIKTACNMLLEKTRKEFNSDIVGFGEYAKINFLTYEDYKKYNWNEKYKYSEFDINVDFQTRKTGLILKKK